MNLKKRRLPGNGTDTTLSQQQGTGAEHFHAPPHPDSHVDILRRRASRDKKRKKSRLPTLSCRFLSCVLPESTLAWVEPIMAAVINGSSEDTMPSWNGQIQRHSSRSRREPPSSRSGSRSYSCVQGWPLSRRSLGLDSTKADFSRARCSCQALAKVGWLAGWLAEMVACLLCSGSGRSVGLVDVRASVCL